MSKKNSQNLEHLMTTVCNSTAVDIDSNNLSIFNIIEEININNENPVDLTQKKFIQVPFELISVWRRLDTSIEISADLKIIFSDPDKEVMQEIPYKLEIKNPHQRMRIRIKGNGLNVTKQGEYYFSILLKNGNSFEEIIKVPVSVKISSPVASDLRILKK
ncbi:MAG: hypothetical protein QG566_369 [Patescibacteria group bacterium]|jgi:hypothetical protein|nr:hypothetical protein [Patescibacteria group bacterium]